MNEKSSSAGENIATLLRPFQQLTSIVPPIWLMRQAGRYLPEYRRLREQAGSFLNLCYSPKLASEVTLQPIRRFDFDAAILFADILIVPDALGQVVEFVEAEGPRLEPITSTSELRKLDSGQTAATFEKIYQTVALIRQELPPDKVLIGFCGAPWTVATYMVAGRGTPDQAAARAWAYRDPTGFAELIELLTTTSSEYLAGQIDAGAQVVQIFDTWAGSLPDDQFARWVIEPTRRIVHHLKQRHPKVPIIGFPRGAGPLTVRYVDETGVDGIGCDTALSLPFIREQLAGKAVVQGNLDPLLLACGGEALAQRVSEILAQLSDMPYVFNLGHGIVPHTPPENVARLVACVRGTAGG